MSGEAPTAKETTTTVMAATAPAPRPSLTSSHRRKTANSLGGLGGKRD